MIWFGLVLWYINHCRLFNVKSSLYIYIKYIWFGLLLFYRISTIVGYLVLDPLYTYILNISGLAWFGLVLWYIIHCRLFSAKSSLYIYIRYIWFGLVWFYAISTIVGYLLQYPFLYILTFLLQTLQFSISTQFKMLETILFQTIQFSISILLS